MGIELTLKAKKKMICRIIEIYVHNGYDISTFLNRKWNSFDYEEIEDDIKIAERNEGKLIL